MSDINQKTVAILYIATGRYTVFWKYFYESAEKYLLNNCLKHYFVFTDNSEDIAGKSRGNVTCIQQNKLGWPFDTLMRFDIFLSIKDQLEAFDYIFFFNGNSEIVSEITSDDLLPLTEDQKLVFAHQPHMFHLSKRKFTYDRNPESSAYIPNGQGQYYFMGGINGGDTSAYLEMCEKLNQNIKSDLEKDVIALWHDESHLNKYALNRDDVKILPPLFSRGEYEYWKKTSKVVFLDKSHYRFGGHAYLRGESEHKISQVEWENANTKQSKFYKVRFKQFIKSLLL